MRIVEQNNLFHLIFSYKPYIINAVKLLPGRRFNYVNKTWNVPIAERASVEQFARKFGFVMGNVKPAQTIEYKIPPLPELKINIPLKIKLFPFQTEGVAYNLQKKRVIIGDHPGLGKTAQAIATIIAAQSFPCLIICPASLKLNWQREWHMWGDHKAMLLSDRNKNTWHLFTKAEHNIFHDKAIADVFITNYESLKKYFVSRIDKPEGKPLRLNHIKFNTNINLFKSVVVDESHRVKDTRTQQTKFTKGICTNKDWIFCLTGTPVVNKPRDLISQLGIINQLERFGGYKRFIDRYCAGSDGYSNLSELNYLLNKTCFYRREKKDVLKDLPDKIRQIVLCEINTRKEYNDALSDLEIYLKKYKAATDEQVQRSMRGEVMVKIGVLKNISARGKLADVIEYVSDIISSGEKLVLFTHLREIQKNIHDHFPKAVTIFGNDSGQTRQMNINKFQNDPNIKLIICSIKAAGVGITLTAASRVAFVELPWHSADTEQCEDRCHRIGQKNSVQCTYFLGKNTIDEWVYQIIEEKQKVSDEITGTKTKVEKSILDGIMNYLRTSKGDE